MHHLLLISPSMYKSKRLPFERVYTVYILIMRPHSSDTTNNNNMYHQLDNHHNFMLTPMGRTDESGRPISPPSRTQLQKPNELDAILSTASPDTSATVYTTSTAEDDHTATPGNLSGSDDPLVHHNTASNKKN